MKRLSVSRLKFIVTSIVLLFILQEVLIHNYISEPYPALRMPPFYGNSLNDEGFYEKTSVDITINFEDKSDLQLTPRDFFYDAPSSHHWVLVSNFRPAGKTSEARSTQQLSFLRPVLPGLFISRNRTPYSIQHNPETKQWLRKQISGIAPDKRPRQISFYWYEDQFAPNDLLNRRRELTGVTTIDL